MKKRKKEYVEQKISLREFRKYTDRFLKIIDSKINAELAYQSSDNYVKWHRLTDYYCEIEAIYDLNLNDYDYYKIKGKFVPVCIDEVLIPEITKKGFNVHHIEGNTRFTITWSR